MFISKHPLGNEIMKGVMSGESTLGMFGYDQAAEEQPLLFPDLPIEALARELLQRFAGKTVRIPEIGVERHAQLGLPDHKRAIQKLESQKKLIVVSYDKVRRLTKDGWSVPDDAILVFSGGDENGAKDAD